MAPPTDSPYPPPCVRFSAIFHVRICANSSSLCLGEEGQAATSPQPPLLPDPPVAVSGCVASTTPPQPPVLSPMGSVRARRLPAAQLRHVRRETSAPLHLGRGRVGRKGEREMGRGREGHTHRHTNTEIWADREQSSPACLLCRSPEMRKSRWFVAPHSATAMSAYPHSSPRHRHAD